jgi:hypothetical protein
MNALWPQAQWSLSVSSCISHSQHSICNKQGVQCTFQTRAWGSMSLFLQLDQGARMPISIDSCSTVYSLLLYPWLIIVWNSLNSKSEFGFFILFIFSIDTYVYFWSADLFLSLAHVASEKLFICTVHLKKKLTRYGLIFLEYSKNWLLKQFSVSIIFLHSFFSFTTFIYIFLNLGWLIVVCYTWFCFSVWRLRYFLIFWVC